MVRHGGHHRVQFLHRQEGSRIQHGRMLTLLLQPHQQPKQRNTGKGMWLCQAETCPGTVDSDFNVLVDLTYKAS